MARATSAELRTETRGWRERRRESVTSWRRQGCMDISCGDPGSAVSGVGEGKREDGEW
jgi:hypothetical protein